MTVDGANLTGEDAAVDVAVITEGNDDTLTGYPLAPNAEWGPIPLHSSVALYAISASGDPTTLASIAIGA